MYVLVLVLEQVDKLPELLQKFIQNGLTGTTVLESTGMGRLLVEWKIGVPMLDFIESSVKDKSNMNKTIFSVIENEESLKEAISTIKKVTGDLNESGRGIMFAWPLTYVEGIKKFNSPLLTEGEMEDLSI
jgi:nitrogen regulatory protein PII